METDIVAIGAGATGLCAALTAAEGNARVIVFEKQPNPGGSSNFAEGMFGVETDMQRHNYIGMTCDEAFRMIMEYNHWLANPRLVRSFVDESAATIDWLQKQGVEFDGPMAMWPDSPRTWHLLKGPPRARGSVMIKSLIARSKERGVDLKVAALVSRIVMEGNRVTGVMVENDGTLVKVNAKAVIIATGGYANSREWIKKYTSFDLDVNLFPMGNVNKTGDGIRMAWDLGAAQEGMGVLQLARMGQGTKGISHVEAARAQPNLFVNPQGMRYCDESIEMNFTFGGNAIARLREKYGYSIFDEAMKRDMIENGIVIGVGMAIPPGTRLINLDEEIKRALAKDSQNLFAAESVDELAVKLGVNPDTLSATFNEYNGCCEKGRDKLFAKNQKHLRPLKEPKFYAVKSVTGFISTLGGIKINHRMEVLDKEERPLPGLYAGGNDAGGLYGDSYDVYAAGETLGFAVNSGRIAGRNALEYIKDR
jgi:fumarate reductase flavoprotein subunit